MPHILLENYIYLSSKNIAFFNLPVYYFLPQKKINEFLILLPVKGICRYIQKGNNSAKSTEKEKLYLEQVISRATFQNF